jgi:predicted ATPase/DNA-binding NarL/FixJ family response regulator
MPEATQQPSDAERDTQSSVIAFPRAPERPPHNLPLELSSFVGRKQEIAEVKALVGNTRLLTLTGPGGSGKTRLGLAVASEVARDFGDGVWLVELAPLSDPDLVPQALASVLGVREAPGSPLTETLSDHLLSRTMLLVLDNCEHLIGACTSLAEALLRHCPNLRVLATSREALGVSGEIIFSVPPLSLPDTRHLPAVESLPHYEAARLFVDRAEAVKPSFALTEGNAMVVAQICHRLDGIPLAIELAAARVRALSVGQISSRLDDSFRLLTGGGRSALAHQRTLRAAMDWSHELLTEGERIAFRRLSVFAGGWTLEAAETVCGGEGIDEGEVMDLLASLVDKSLVLVTEQRDGEVRYRLLETVRQYALEKLEESGEAVEVRGRHAAWFLALAEEAGPLMMGRDQVGWLDRTWPEQHNFRAAVRCFLERKDADRAIGLTWAFWRYWWVTGLQGEARRWMEEVLESGDLAGNDVYPARRAQANLIIGTYAWSEGDLVSALPALEEGLRLSRKTDDALTQAIGLMLLGLVEVAEGNAKRSRERFEESLRFFRISGESEKWGEAHTLAYLGLAPLLNGEPEAARRCFEEGLAAARAAGDRVAAHQALYKLGLLALTERDLDRANEAFREGLSLADEVRDIINAPYFVKGLGQVAGLRGQAAVAVRILGAAESALRATGSAPYRYIPDQALQDRIFAAARDALGETTFDEEWRRGRAMTLKQAVDYALQEPEAPQKASEEAEEVPQAFPAALSAREVEILRLVARGMTNAQIGEELYISTRTVNAHLRSVYHKIGTSTRAEAARFALEHDLL